MFGRCHGNVTVIWKGTQLTSFHPNPYKRHIITGLSHLWYKMHKRKFLHSMETFARWPTFYKFLNSSPSHLIMCYEGLSSEFRSNTISFKKPFKILQLKLILLFLGTHSMSWAFHCWTCLWLVQLQDGVTHLRFLSVLPMTPTHMPCTFSSFIKLVKNCVRPYQALQVYKPFLGFGLFKFNYRNDLNKDSFHLKILFPYNHILCWTFVPDICINLML